jgi:hypothetical protein
MNRSVRGLALALVLTLGAGRASADMPADAHVHGMLDLNLTNGEQGIEDNYLNAGDTNFDPYRLRLFVDGRPATGFEVFTQFIWSEAKTVSADGVYARWTPNPDRDLHLVIGKMPWIIGTWAPRTYSDKNPLIGMPMMYHYHTTLREDGVPPTADALLQAAGTGQYGVDYGSGAGYRGMPIVYDRCWDYGVAGIGSLRPLEFSIGVENGTPSSPNPGVDWNNTKGVLGRIGLAPTPSLRVGVSGAWGAYLMSKVQPQLPPGASVDDYHQILGMADLELTSGRFELRSEGYYNTWTTPTVGDLHVHGGYGELKVTLIPGLWAAARGEVMRFSDLTGATLGTRPWDDNRDRFEGGLGYRVTREVLLKSVFQRTVHHEDDGNENYDLGALELSLVF